jgi:hypothetical protein
MEVIDAKIKIQDWPSDYNLMRPPRNLAYDAESILVSKTVVISNSEMLHIMWQRYTYLHPSRNNSIHVRRNCERGASLTFCTEILLPAHYVTMPVLRCLHIV